jgi:acyl-CoA reductase-like NAD-dependent aldehyde dehydrogenase
MSIIDTLTNKDLMPSLCFVNGEWTDMGVSARVDVINPADGAVIGSIPSLTKKEVDKAVDAAAEAFKSFKGTLAEERANLLKKWHQLIIENQDDLTLMLTAEMGKPLEEARGEILYTASFIEWFAEEARRVRGDIIATPTQTYFTSTYSSIPRCEPSRPMPDSFMPPKGATVVDISASFAPTMPYSSASLMRQIRF